jgi:MFS family permease
MTAAAPARHDWLAFYVLCMGVLMIVLDTTIVNVALPSIKADLGFSETALAWVVNAYMLTYGGFLLLAGRLGDLLGHRRVFLLGLAAFTAASLLCGLATSQLMLVAARAAQGLGGAVVSAVALSLIMDLFTAPADRARAMGIYGFVCAGGGSVGVLLGGLLTSTLSWHWIFLVNLPIGVLVALATLRLVPATRKPFEGRLDVAGAASVTLALTLAIYAVVHGNEAGWTSPATLGVLGVALMLLVAFVTIEARIRAPLIPLGLFRHRNLTVASLIGVLWCAAMFAWFFLSALYMQQVLGYDPFRGAGVPAGEPGDGRLLGRPVRAAGDALRHPPAAGRRAGDGGDRAGAVRPRAGGRSVRGRRAAGDAAAGPGRRHRLQPGAAGGDGRRGAGPVRAGLWRGQHRLHDGRRPGPGGACQPRCGTDEHPDQCRCQHAGRAQRRLSHGFPGGRLCGGRRRAGRGRAVAASGHGPGGRGRHRPLNAAAAALSRTPTPARRPAAPAR